MIKNITIGSDPEFAAFENEEPKSAVGFIPGTKREPFPLTEESVFVKFFIFQISISIISWDSSSPIFKKIQQINI